MVRPFDCRTLDPLPVLLSRRTRQLLRERGYCKFGGDTCIGLEDIRRKREGGLEIAPPPSGARVNQDHQQKPNVA